MSVAAAIYGAAKANATAAQTTAAQTTTNSTEKEAFKIGGINDVLGPDSMSELSKLTDDDARKKFIMSKVQNGAQTYLDNETKNGHLLNFVDADQVRNVLSAAKLGQ
jgi:hypothetical protein